MDDLERAISERQETIRRLEKEIDQARCVLINAQKELDLLQAARQIVSKEKLIEEFSSAVAQLPLEEGAAEILTTTTTSLSASARGAMAVRASMSIGEMSLVNEVRATLENSEQPMGPSEIRRELARHGRDVPQNVMTGVLSRLNKEGRVTRLERGKYVAAI
mgnify:CR=1 FL=1